MITKTASAAISELGKAWKNQAKNFAKKHLPTKEEAMWMTGATAVGGGGGIMYARKSERDSLMQQIQQDRMRSQYGYVPGQI